MTQINKTITGEKLAKQEAFYDQVIRLTPSQIDTYIENNVTDLASAKVVLKKFGKVLLFLAKEHL